MTASTIDTLAYQYATATNMAARNTHTAWSRRVVDCSQRSARGCRFPRHIRDDVASLLDLVNGRRRTRVVELDDVLDAISCAAHGSSIEYIHGGHVANAYKYPAVATAVLVVRQGSFVAIHIRESNARKGSTGFGKVSSHARTDARGDALRDEFVREAPIVLRLY